LIGGNWKQTERMEGNARMLKENNGRYPARFSLTPYSFFNKIQSTLRPFDINQLNHIGWVYGLEMNLGPRF
jgi:hypothetical protein